MGDTTEEVCGQGGGGDAVTNVVITCGPSPFHINGIRYV